MQTFLKNPITVSVKSRETVHNVDQDVIKMNGRLKVNVLHDLLTKPGFDKVLVFGRTKWGIEKLSKTLQMRGFKASAIHGNKNQNQHSDKE
jgi:ATP-dependent RNA helicase RhlE